MFYVGTSELDTASTFTIAKDDFVRAWTTATRDDSAMLHILVGNILTRIRPALDPDS